MEVNGYLVVILPLKYLGAFFQCLCASAGFIGRRLSLYIMCTYRKTPFSKIYVYSKCLALDLFKGDTSTNHFFCPYTCIPIYPRLASYNSSCVHCMQPRTVPLMGFSSDCDSKKNVRRCWPYFKNGYQKRHKSLDPSQYDSLCRPEITE